MPRPMDQDSDATDRGLRRVLRDAWQRFRGSISLLVVAACVALFLLVALLDLLSIVPRGRAVGFLGLSYVGLFHRQWLHQFFTASLLHGGVVHLVFNMLALWMLGPDVEKALGRGRYVVFSCLCAFCSMIGFLVSNWGTGNVVVGYSGVIFGILVAQAVLFPDARIAFFGFFLIKMKHAVLLLGAVELYLTISPEGAGISHAAHLFGALAALVYLKGASWRQALATRTSPFTKRRLVRKLANRKRDADVPREL